MSAVAYREVEVKSALNEVRGMPFAWSLNPCLGCAHACTYCFSRAYHARYRERNVGSDFDKNVEVRVNIADTLRHELRRPKDGSLAIGTATDPYQPIEGKYQLTRRCLEALADYPMPMSIITKGPLVVRDIDVLKRIDERTELTVFFSVPCVDEVIVKKTDPGRAPPRQRLLALRIPRATASRTFARDGAATARYLTVGTSGAGRSTAASSSRRMCSAASWMSSPSVTASPAAVPTIVSSESHQGVRIPKK